MWYVATSASVTNGSTVVMINTGDDISNVQEKSALIFEDGSPVEIVKAYLDGTGNKIIQLARPWAYPTKTGKPLVIYPTAADFAAATAELRRVIGTLQVASTVEAKTGTDDEKVMTPLKTKESVDFRLDQRLENINDELDVVKATHPFPWAMRKVEFEANRAQNNEKFAASGFVRFGIGHSGSNVNEGMWVDKSTPNTFHLGKSGVSSGHIGSSKTDYPQVNIAGVVSKIQSIGYGASVLSRVKLPPAEDGTRTYDSSTGASVTHATPAIAFASETETNKVVTDRVDMWGFEAYLREVTDADPFVYANGLIQSLASKISGVTAVSDNVRPITYFAWYEGDEGSRGRGVNWQTASEANRIKIACDPANNIYFDDETGKFYQWCIRGRSFAGAGNGDWNYLNSNGELGKGNALNFNYSTIRKLVNAMGDEDTDLAYTPSLPSSFQSLTYLEYNNRHNYGRGIFSTGDNKVHFLVCGTVTRLNQGFYHPSLNALGSVADINGGKWYDTTLSFTSTSDFFDSVKLSSTVSGRPDDRLANYIYASGQGGVCRDMRYSAWGLKAEDFAEADLKVKSGEYRGRETLKKVFWVGHANNTKSDVAKEDIYLDFGATGTDPLPEQISSRLVKSTSVYTPISGEVVTTNGVYLVVGGRVNPNLDRRVYLKTIPSSEAVPIEMVAVTLSEDLNVPISGEYTHTEVIGDPANILLCDDLKDGWVGSWNPTIPDGTSKRFKLHKKVLRNSDDRIHYSSNNGTSWEETFSAHNLNSETNSVGHPTVFAGGNVCVYQYSAKANSTQDSLNSRVYGGDRGIGDVYTTHLNQTKFGSLLTQSLLGDIATGNSDIGFATYRLSEYNLSLASGVIFATGNMYTPQHPNITLVGVTGVGVKALNYNVEENQQGFINYAYTELKHNDTDWGDDGKIHIVDNQSTMLDTNGQTVKVGTARIVEPLGWIKNDK